MYVWDAGGDNFLLSYLTAYTEANVEQDQPDYWGNDVYWYEYDYYTGDGGAKELIGYWPTDPYKIPANYWFVTEMWFTLGNVPALSGITLTVYEFSSASDMPYSSGGTLLPDVSGLPEPPTYYTYTPSGWQ